jgi:hypothetical protein
MQMSLFQLFFDPFPGLFNEFNKAYHLRFRPCIDNLIKRIFRQTRFQMSHDIKVFPPAVENFPTNGDIISACSAVMERDSSSQSGASSFEVVFTFVHLSTAF